METSNGIPQENLKWFEPSMNSPATIFAMSKGGVGLKPKYKNRKQVQARPILVPCSDCGLSINEGKQSKNSRCDKCKNKRKYQARKILLKLKRLRNKKCHNCGGAVEHGVYCSDYCRWIKHLSYRYRQKIVLRLSDLKK